MNKLHELQLVVDQIGSEIKVDEQGVGSLSIRALARICDVNHKTLVHHFSGGQNSGNPQNLVTKNTSKLHESLVEHGFQSLGFGQHGIPDIAAYLVIDYYAHNAGKNCTTFAKIAQKAIGAIGMRQWCREITGWSETDSKAISVDTTTAESMFREMMEMKQTMKQLLTVAETQVKQLTAQVEEKQVVINEMVEKEELREAKFLLYPGLKEATDFALEWDDTIDEEVFFTLRQFCEVNQIVLSR